MTGTKSMGSICYVTLLVFQWFQHSVMAAEKEMFACDYIDDEYKILRLRCHKDCSTGHSLVNIIIYNATSLDKMAALLSGKPPTALKPPFQEISYYVGGCVPADESSCHLELIITNVDKLAHLNFGCNVTCSDFTGSFSTVSTTRAVDRKAATDGSHKLSTNTVIILIVIIVVLFLLTVLFLSVWLRGWCRRNNKGLYQTPPQSESNHSQALYGDTTSVFSFQKPPSKLNVRRPTNGSIQRMSRSETNITANRTGHLPLPPPVPPPKLYSRDRPSYNQQTSACSVVKVAYAKPQDAIEPDFSEDGDVTSGNNDNQHSYPYHKERSNPHTFYSSVPVNSVDV